ncbi:hypothetical protein HYT01_03400 [Candidatus Giovannonibacteria bacterium]|nr:hypothetical protein [Candidatus Giovannonibacteria bacterium]
MTKLKYVGILCFLALLGALLPAGRPFFAYAAGDAGLFLSPASGSFVVGSTVDVSIILDTKGKAVNTVEIELAFPADKLQLANPSVGKSIIQLWPAPPSYSNREGKIYFVGGIPSPGIVTSQGVVLTLTFRVIAPGEGQIKFGERTKVLANDGRGTDILGQSTPSFIRFLLPPSQGPQIFSPTHPDQERWYRDPNPVFVWQKGQFAEAYSYSIDEDPSGFPDTVSEGKETTASFGDLKSGMRYFHLREKNAGVWGGVSHYSVKIDKEPPASFMVSVSPGLHTTSRNPIFRFFTTDALSGLDRFEMKIVSLSSGVTEDSLFFGVNSPYQAPNFNAGRYQVIVRAVDLAGNTTDETVTMNIVGAATRFFTPEGIDLIFFFVPWIWAVVVLGLLFLLFLILLFMLWIRHKHHLKHAFREDFKKLLGLMGDSTPPLPPVSGVVK